MNRSVDAIATIRYIRLQWSLLEPDADNEWNFAPLDSAIEKSASDGKQAAIAVMGHTPKLGGRSRYTQAIPRWYLEAAEARGPRCTEVGDGGGLPRGCTHYLTDYVLGCQSGETCQGLWTFNHNDDAYIRQQVELIQALRERYDTPDWAGRIAYVDVRGGLGSWTEGHVDGVRLAGSGEQWPMPSYENKVKIAEAYLSFEYLPIVANIRNGGMAREAAVESQWVYLCEQGRRRNKIVGWRTDGLDTTKYLIDPVFSAHPFMKDCWKQGPVHGELNARALADPSPVDRDPWSAGRTQYFALNKRMEAWHVSGWSTKYHPYPGDPETYRAALDEWRAIGGYRLGVSSAAIPDALEAGTPFQMSIDLRNSGTAPVYRRWYRLGVRFEHLETGDSIVLSLPGDLTAVMPDEPPTGLVAKGAALDRPGLYRVSVGVIQDPRFTQVRPLKLAHRVEDCRLVGETYWCDLAEVGVD
ncbi:DUF4832 domain-containing protein [Thiorhodococcus minor]|uniref:DUF4832 domain-containing protein n=1 Tax=Thiorhodococcus minor TaxID=57489 RepID=A0A6M0K0K9_9GAMM|nr:DUF4832 domain-containing protein [Thiorhodococcus minor]NEV62834.1 hypothetical protein [Thiorhodococcus minor]